MLISITSGFMKLSVSGSLGLGFNFELINRLIFRAVG